MSTRRGKRPPAPVDETYLLDNGKHVTSSEFVRVGALERRSRAHGPGTRAVVWVTGCNRRCPGCIKPNWLPFEAGEPVCINELADAILSLRGIDGVSFSGGEPFEQATALGLLATKVRSGGLDVLAYSGYRLDALDAAPRFAPLLERLDWLIDGEFQQALHGPHRWRGSENQRVLRMPARVEESFEAVREVQISVSADTLAMSGFPGRDVERVIVSGLNARGLRLEEG